LINHIRGKQVNNLVHINRIKPYFYRDEIPDDPSTLDDEVAVALDDTLIEVPAPETGAVQQKAPSKQRGRPKGSGKVKQGAGPNNKQVPMTVPTDTLETPTEVPTTTDPRLDSADIEHPLDFDIMYEAECIMKQRNQRGGRHEFLVRLGMSRGY